MPKQACRARRRCSLISSSRARSCAASCNGSRSERGRRIPKSYSRSNTRRSAGGPTSRSASTGHWKGTGFMPLTRGEAVGYDADLMVFKFTMRNGEQIVQCQISSAALGDLADRRSGAARDLPAEFEAHRELIEAIASELFDQTSVRKRGWSAFFRNTFRTQRKSKDTYRQDAFAEAKAGPTDGRPIFAVRTRCRSKKVNKSST